MRSIIIFFVFILPTISFGQTSCKEYSDKVRQGYQYLKSNDPASAYKLFNNAQKIGIAKCNLKSTIEAEEGMVKAFDALNRLKESAEQMVGQLKKKDKVIDSLQKQKEAEEKGYKIRLKELISNFGGDTSDIAIESVYIKMKSGESVSEITPTYSGSKKPRVIENTTSNIFTVPLYAQAKNIIDSLWKYSKGNLINSNKSEDEVAMSLLLKSLDSDINFNILAKHLLDSTKKELEKLKPGISQYDFTVYTYLRAVLYYSWNLSLKGKDSLLVAKTTLNDAATFCKSIPKKSAIIYSGMAGLYNSYNNYYGIIDSTKLAFEAIETALDYGTSAVRLNPDNYLYQRGLATLISNSTYISGSYLSLMDKVELARLSYKCLKNMETYFPYNGNSLSELYNSSTNLSNRLMDAGYFTNAADTLKNTIEVLNQYISRKVLVKDVELNKLKLLIKTSGIYIGSINSFTSGIKYLKESYTFFTAIKQDTTDNADVDRLVELNASLDNLLKYTKSKQDSLSAITTFTAAIQAYEKISPLSRGKYKTFSEDVYRFAQPYVRRLELNILRDNREEADRDFTVLEKTFFPYYYKYRFDFYLGQPLIRASKVYANYLCGQGSYKQALPLLKFASLEGIKESTDSLIAIYQKNGFVNSDSLKFYKNRTSYQSNGIKRFTVPTDFNGVKFPLNVYILDRAKEYDTMYTGIRDQVQWVWKARQGKVPEDVITSFDKLQKIAWDNNVSFMDLSVYALGAAQQELTLDIPSYKTKIKEEKDCSEKVKLYEKLTSIYDDGIKKANKEELTNKKTLAQNYNSLGWESLLAGQFKNVVSYFEKSLEFDSTNVYARGNMAHAYLFTNQIEKAKKEYLRLKDVKIENDSRYETLKDAFLDDFQEFKKVGIVNENIKEIIRLLNEK